MVEKLKSGAIKVPAFFSNNGVDHFVKLLKKNNIDPKTLDCIAFSAQIAQNCTMFRRTAICQQPDMDSMKHTMEAVKRHIERQPA